MISATPVSAVAYDLIAPSGTLTRGQDVQFIINIDSEGTNLTNTQIGMSYETEYLQYVSTTPGDSMTSITAIPSGTNNIIITGSNPDGFNGSGVFAYVTFKIIAAAPGSTELCALFAPTTTPTPSPVPTSPPVVTELPKAGILGSAPMLAATGTALLLTSAASFYILRKPRTTYPYKKH